MSVRRLRILMSDGIGTGEVVAVPATASRTVLAIRPESPEESWCEEYGSDLSRVERPDNLPGVGE